jgi:uncharacterized membrane protein YccC
MIELLLVLLVFIAAFVLVQQYVPAPAKMPLLVVIGVVLVVWVLRVIGALPV